MLQFQSNYLLTIHTQKYSNFSSIMNFLTIKDYQSTTMTSSKSYKLKINNKDGKNRLNFGLEQVSNSSRRSASFRKKSSSRLFKDAKIIPISNLKTDKSQSPKMTTTTPTIRSQKGKRVSFNLESDKNSQKFSICPKRKAFSKPAKRILKVSNQATKINITVTKSQKQSNFQKTFENEQKDFFLPETEQKVENNKFQEHGHINLVQRNQSSQSNGMEFRNKRSKTPSKHISQKQTKLMESISLLIMNNCKQISNEHENKLSSVDFEESILESNENSIHSLELQMDPENFMCSHQLRDLSYLISQN